MATPVSGSLSANGVSANLALGAVLEELTLTLTGTWSGKVYLERALSSAATAWEVYLGPLTVAGTYHAGSRPNDILRVRMKDYVSGSAVYNLADGDADVYTLRDADNRPLYRATQGAHYFYGDVNITGTLTSGNSALSTFGPADFFRFGYGATRPLVKMQSAGTDAAGSGQQVLSVSHQVTHSGAGAGGALGALYSASTIDGAPNTDYYAAAFTMTNRAKRDPSSTADEAQHGTLFTHQIKDLPTAGFNPGDIMADSWIQWWVAQDRTNLPSSEGGAMVGVEFDWFGNNQDDADKRFARQVVLSNYAHDASKPFEVAYGDYWNSFTGGALDTFFNVVSAYYAGWTVAGIDMSQGTGARANPYIDGVNRGVAIKLRDGAKLGFNGDGATGSYMTHDTSRFQFWNNGAEVASISDTGVGIFGTGAGSAPITVTSGVLSVPSGQNLSLRVASATNTITLGAPGAGLGNALTVTAGSGGNTAQSATPNIVSAGNMLEAPFLRMAVGTNFDITGTSTLLPRMDIRTGISGTNTTTGSTGPAVMRMSGTYSGSMPNGIFNMLGIYENASGFDGALTGVKVQLATTGTSSLSASSFGLIATEFVSIGSHNLGGVSTAFGVTNFGIGALFAANPRSLNKAGTWYATTIGQETAAAIYSGASSNDFVVHQLVLEDLHAVHGVMRDAMLVMGAQALVTAGTREGIEIGGRNYHWPIDANGYIMAAHIPASWTARPSTAAGGIDFNDVAFAGTGEWGGGFVLRGRGISLIPTAGNGGELRAGFGSLASTATGVDLSANQDQMTGTPTVNAGGTNWVQDMIAGDVYGNLVQVNVTAGVVTSIKAVINRGFVPTGTGATTGVAFTCKNAVSLSYGQGLTLNLTWTPQTTLALQSGAGPTEVGGSLTTEDYLWAKTTVTSGDGTGNGEVQIYGSTSGTKKFAFYEENSGQILRWTIGATTANDFTLERFNSSGVSQGNVVKVLSADSRILLPALQASTTYANDAAAAIGGVPVGGLYRNGSVVMIRIV